jgi:hypothetical protein
MEREKLVNSETNLDLSGKELSERIAELIDGQYVYFRFTNINNLRRTVEIVMKEIRCYYESAGQNRIYEHLINESDLGYEVRRLE